MNTSQYMDKQVMDLSASAVSTHNKDFLDDDDHHIVGGGATCDSEIGKEEIEIEPSYDFQPIRPLVTSAIQKSLDGASRPWSSADSKIYSSASPIENYGSVDNVEPSKIILEKDQNAIDAVVMTEIDRTMKKYTDTLLHVLEGVSARLTQLESRTHHVENSVDELKLSVGNNQGSTEGKMRHLENILREVQTGVRVLNDKQEIVEAQLQLANLQGLKVDLQPEHQKTGHVDSVQKLSPVNLSQPSPALPPNALPPPVPVPTQFPQNHIPAVPQREPYFPPPGQTPEVPDQQYQLPQTQQPYTIPPGPTPEIPNQQYQLPQTQQYQPVPQQQYSQPPQQHPSLPRINHPPQLQSSLGHHSEESPYATSQSYPPTLRPPPSGPAPSQQFHGPLSHMYEPPASRTSSGFSTGYGPPPGPSEPYPPRYGSGSLMKPHQPSSPAMHQGGGSGYPQLPTARVLPTASGVGIGSGPAGSGNRVPVDDIIDRVTTMGFPRDHVRATVGKLTESGQSVDLNAVLDKLMNDGEVQPQRGWPYAR